LEVVLVVVAMATAFAVEVEMNALSRAEMEISHYQRLWSTGRHTANIEGQKAWLCCRACPQNTVPMMHEEFEGDKNKMPEVAPSPPEEKKDDKTPPAKSFLELAGARSDEKAYSCCNQCPDLMMPFPRKWNDPSPYSYVPKRLFRFKQKQLSADADGDAVFAETSDPSISRYVPTNPHNLPQYPYFESGIKAGPARSPAARDGTWEKGTPQKPLDPNAVPIWHPPPPPHDDIYRMTRSPNLHDGFDLKTEFVMPPCCDFCMSTYFPQIINDELQLPTREPYTMAKVSFAETSAKAKARSEEVIEAMTDDSDADSDSDSDSDSDAALLETDESKDSKGSGEAGAGAGADADTSGGAGAAAAASVWEIKVDPNKNGINSREMLESLQPRSKSDPTKCCHKCIRKDIEDTDWHIYALQTPPKHKPRPRW